MSRVLLLALEPHQVEDRCKLGKVDISVLEKLASGGVRLVCSCSDGSARMRQVLKRHLISGVVTRERYRPAISSR